MAKRRKMKGVVDKVIKPTTLNGPERAQISIPEAEALYREIRIDNVVTGEHGEKAHLKEESEVDVIVEADTDATTKIVEG